MDNAYNENINPQLNHQEKEVNPNEAMDVLGNISNRINRMENPEIRKIYIQFEAIQDFRLGALMHGLITDIENEYLQSKLDAYAESLDLQCAKHFPALQQTEQTLDDMLSRDDIADEILLGSPLRNVFIDISHSLAHMQSFREMEDKTKPVDIYISVKHVEPTNLFKFKWLHWIQNLLKDNVTVHYFKGGPEDLPTKFIKDMDVMCIFDVPQLFRSSAMAETIKQMKPGEKLIWGLRCIDEDETDINSPDLQERIKRTEFILSSAFNYNPFSKSIIRNEQNE